MKIIKSELAFDPEGFRRDDDGERRATILDIDSGKEAFHPYSGDRTYRKDGKYFLEGGDMASMVADESGIENPDEGPLVVEVDRDKLKHMMEEPDDPEGWHLGPVPEPTSRRISRDT